jgi:hypothetical protein
LGPSGKAGPLLSRNHFAFAVARFAAFEHDLSAKCVAAFVSQGKTGFHFALTRPSGANNALDQRMQSLDRGLAALHSNEKAY